MAKKNLIQEAVDASPNRRRFMKTLGVASAAVAATQIPGKAAGFTDADVLNFALNLEWLEAEFYTVAVTGKNLHQSGFAGAQSTTSGGKQVTFNNSVVFTGNVAAEIMKDEQDHVTLLRGLLGSAAITEPAINLNALGGVGFEAQSDFLVLARAFEDTGVSAYAGAAPLLTQAANIGYAARILAAEAEHVANVRLQIARLNIATSAYKLDPKDILPPPSGTLYFSLNSNALVETRTIPEVLFIVYGFVSGVAAGGFFPMGVNGYFAGTKSMEATAMD